MTRAITKRLNIESILAASKLGASTFFKLLAGLIITKLIAVNAGLSGFGIVGQFQSILSITMVFAGGGIITGVVRYIAELRNEGSDAMKHLTQTSSFITICFGIVLGALAFFFSEQLSEVVFGSRIYAQAFVVLSVCQFIIGLNNLFTAILNGYRDVNGLALSSIIGSLLGLVLFYFYSMGNSVLHVTYGLIGFGVSANFLSLYLIFRKGYVSPESLLPKLHKGYSRKVLSYSGLLLVSAVTLPSVHIWIRNLLSSASGWEFVSYWQGVTKISDAYIQFATAVLTGFFYPKFAAAQSRLQLKSELVAALKAMIPGTMVLAGIVLLFRSLIIQLLFSNDFQGMGPFFPFQLLGDIFKVAAYVMLYITLAKGLFKTYILGEFVQATILITMSKLGVTYFGPVGITYAYAATYILYAAYAVLICHLYTSNHRLYQVAGPAKVQVM